MLDRCPKCHGHPRWIPAAGETCEDCHLPVKFWAMFAETKQLRSKYETAMRMLQYTRERARITFGWDMTTSQYGYYLDQKWCGPTLDDAITEAAKESAEPNRS